MTKNRIKTIAIVILMVAGLLLVGNVAGNPVSDCEPVSDWLNDDVLPIDWTTLKWDFDALDFDWTIIDPPVYERM